MDKDTFVNCEQYSLAGIDRLTLKNCRLQLPLWWRFKMLFGWQPPYWQIVVTFTRKAG